MFACCTALKEVANTLAKDGINSEIVWIGNKPVGGCIACKVCVKKDLEGLYTMRVLGRNMAYMLKCKEAAEMAGIPMPKQEPAIFTNFIHD